MSAVIDNVPPGAAKGPAPAILTPGDPGYDQARTVWNAMIDRRPRIIARCAGAADVAAAVRTARDLGLEIGVRCGGHSVLGLAVPGDGLMIDLTPMGGVRVDPARRRAVVQDGRCWGRWTVRRNGTGWRPPRATTASS
jgi:FAD binding domain